MGEKLLDKHKLLGDIVPEGNKTMSSEMLFSIPEWV
jgi:hypothetical protein